MGVKDLVVTRLNDSTDSTTHQERAATSQVNIDIGAGVYCAITAHYSEHHASCTHGKCCEVSSSAIAKEFSKKRRKNRFESIHRGTMKSMNTYYNVQKKHIKEFQLVSRALLNKTEQHFLYNVLKDYQQKQNVNRLVQELQGLLGVPEKFQLFKILRNLIPLAHLHEFDRLNYSKPEKHKTKFNSYEKRNKNAMDGNLDKDCGRRDIRVLVINRNPLDESLGFSIRGGAEHGLGIYVSEVDPGSVAELSGLHPGDKIMEANNTCLENVTSGQAVRALTSDTRSKLVIQRTNKVPEWKLAKQKTLWYNTRNKTITTDEGEESNMAINSRELYERRVIVSASKKNKIIGINVRGGMEYGLGIYVSRVDSYGLADKKGIRPGDQIMDVNGVPFHNIMHHHAVDILRNQMPLIFIIRHVGRYPVYKELCAEYTWSDGHCQLPAIHLPYSDADVYSMVEERFTDTCIDESDGSMRHLPSESGIDLMSYHSQNPIEYQDKAYHTYHQKKDFDAFLPKPSDVVYKRKQQWDGAHSDDELELSRRMESWVHGVDRGNVNPGYASESELDGPVNRRRRSNKYNDAEICRSRGSVPERKTSKEILQKDRSSSFERALEVEANPDYFDIHDDANSLCEEQTMSFFISDKNDGGSYRTERENQTTEEISQNRSSRNLIDDAKAPRTQNMYTDKSKDEICSHDSAVSHIERPRSPISPSDKYKKLGMTGVQEMEYIMDKANSPDVNYRSVEYMRSSSGLVTNSFGNPVGTLTPSKEANFEEGYFQVEGPLVTSLYSPDLHDQIQDLEYRKSNLGIRELDALTNTAVISDHDKMDMSPGVPDGKASTRKKKWKSVKERFMGSLRKTTKTLDKMNYNSDVDKYTMSLVEDSAKLYLEEDEYYAVMRHIQNYHNTHDLDWLVEVLLAILDKPEKILLLKEIRSVIYETDKSRFDQKVNRYQEDAYEKLTTKVHLPLTSNKSKVPKKTLMATEKGYGDHFHIKSVEQAEREKTKQRQVLDILHDRDRKSCPPPKKTDEYGESAKMSDYMLGERDIVIREITHDLPQKSEKEIVAYISKNKSFLGMRVSGGADFEEQTEVMIDWVEPGGAASDEGNIQSGMVILAVDDQDLRRATHGEAVAALKKSFSNKRNVTMKLVLRNPNYL
ncbi:hypothetical protein ScPMuIL_001643 [Solemya velum]